ncbi:MAG TPA: hypothetical protein VK034_22340, partial [Enhygromyxa sp.]|nr:hypothetical protein [Enhygromyxa sp.]
ALVAWQELGGVRYVQLDEALQPITDVGAWTIAELGLDPKVAAGPDGGYCVAGIVDDAAPKVSCFDALGAPLSGSSWPMASFGGIEIDGKHDLIGTDSGYLYIYVPDATAHTLWAEPLSLDGASAGLGFEIAALPNPLGSWVGQAGATIGPGFVALAGELGSQRMPTAHTLYYRPFMDSALPSFEPDRVGSWTPEGSDFEGTVVAHTSGRFAIAWLTSVTWALDNVSECELSVRLFEPDATPHGGELTLFEPGSSRCVQGVRGVSDADGDVLWTWRRLQQGGTTTTMQAAFTPRLLGWP